MRDGQLAAGYRAQVDMIDEDNWMRNLEQFDGATIYQTWSYGKIRWGQEKLSHLILRRNDQVVSAAQCIIKQLRGIRAGIAYVPWGPLWRRPEVENDETVFQQMLCALYSEYVEKRGLFLRIFPNEADEGTNPLVGILRERGFRLHASVPPYRTFIIDLGFSMEDLRKGFKRQWRQNLQRSENNELRVIHKRDQKGYEAFVELYRDMRTRKDFQSGVDIGEFGKIQGDLSDPFKMEVMICESDGEPVAGIVVSRIGRTAICLLAATTEKALELRAAYLLQYHTVEWLKGLGVCWYDLGGIDREKNPGGYQYKSGLSGKCGKEVQYIGQYTLSGSVASSVVVGLGSKLQKTYRMARGLA